ncbi:MAG TPA: hypothetical protein VG435_13220 [Acidimicrobiales bacterium]|jgi:hypothetical protein|nr:hypothetical protein [Acidimicrobiales bacterium]
MPGPVTAGPAGVPLGTDSSGAMRDYVLSLQRVAGNQATSTLLDGGADDKAPRLSVKPADLDAVAGKTSGGFLGKGRSSILDIRDALNRYDKASQGGRPDTKQDQVLEKLDRLTTKWINSHRGDRLSDDQRKTRSLLIKLSDELPDVRASTSQRRAHDRYIADASAGTYDARPLSEGAVTPNAATTTPFKAMGATSARSAAAARTGYAGLRDRAEEVGKDPLSDPAYAKRMLDKYEARMSLVRQYRLTEAEHAAITTYTDSSGDFQYINAAAANSKEWMGGIKADEQKTPTRHAKQGDRTLREEGALHAGMASSGLRKLPPYPGVSYRGESMTLKAFKEKAKVGKVAKFPNLTSSSKRNEVALKFAWDNLGEQKNVAVIWAFSDAGGRDVEALSSEDGEGEVLFLPGTSFVTSSIAKIGSPTGAASAGLHSAIYNQALDKMGQPTSMDLITGKKKAGASEAYLVTVDLASGKQEATEKWSGAKPQAAADKTAVPTSPGTLGLDRGRSDRAFDTKLARALAKLQKADQEATMALMMAERKLEPDEKDRGAPPG